MTSRVTDEDMVYEDEGPEILAVLPATGWAAVVGGEVVPLVVFVALDDGRLYGVAVDNDGRIDLTENVSTYAGFTGYIQTNNEPKENQ